MACLALFCVIANAETNDNAPASVRMSVSTLNTETGAEIGEVQMLVGTSTNIFTSTAAIESFFSSLPPETIVTYVAPYGKHYVMIGTNKMRLSAFGKLMAGKGIKFNAMVPDF